MASRKLIICLFASMVMQSSLLLKEKVTPEIIFFLSLPIKSLY